MKTDKEIADMVRAGKPVILAEYRGGGADDIKWRDKKTGQQKEGVMVRDYLETEALGPVGMSNFAPDGFKKADWKQPFPKGTKVLVTITGMQANAGVITFKGTLTALT